MSTEIEDMDNFVSSTSDEVTSSSMSLNPHDLVDEIITISPRMKDDGQEELLNPDGELTITSSKFSDFRCSFVTLAYKLPVFVYIIHVLFYMQWNICLFNKSI